LLAEVVFAEEDFSVDEEPEDEELFSDLAERL
jgi:hypothetical protein